MYLDQTDAVGQIHVLRISSTEVLKCTAFVYVAYESKRPCIKEFIALSWRPDMYWCREKVCMFIPPHVHCSGTFYVFMPATSTVHTCVDTYRRTHAHTHARMHARAHRQTHTIRLTHTHTHTHTHIHTLTHARTHARTHAHTHTHTHTHTHMQARTPTIKLQRWVSIMISATCGYKTFSQFINLK